MLLVNRSTNTVVSDQVQVAGNFYRRLRGLMGQKHLACGSALVLEPCRQVHTFFMRFPIDVVFLDGQGAVLVTLVITPGRISPYIRKAQRVVELPAGTAAAKGIAENHILQLISLTAAKTPAKSERGHTSHIGS